MWTIVSGAIRGSPEVRFRALEILCRNYWFPIYACARRRGNSPDDAKDLTQGFMVHLLEPNTLRSVDSAKGRFRSFLIASFENFANNEYDRSKAIKRGGGYDFFPLDGVLAEERYQSELALHPQMNVDVLWALTLKDNVVRKLKEEYNNTLRRRKVFENFKWFILGELEDDTYRRLSQELGMTEGALHVALHHLRRRFGELLRSEVAHTVLSPEDIKDEIRQVLAALELHA